MLKKIIRTLEEEGIIRSTLPPWRRALIAYFLSNRTQNRLGAEFARPAWEFGLRCFGEKPERAKQIVSFIIDCANYGSDEAYAILSAWARGDVPWSVTWRAYRAIITAQNPLPDHLMKIAEELARE